MAFWLIALMPVSNLRSQISIGEIHDYFMQAFCDSVANWQTTRTPISEEEMTSSVWNMLYNGLPEKLGITQQQLDAILSQIGINQHNFVNAPTIMYDALDETRKNFVDDLIATYTANFDLPDKELIQIIQAKKQDWVKRLPKNEIDYAIEVAVSSMIYWKHHASCIIAENTKRACTDNKIGAARVAQGDITGAINGALSGAILGAGALVGATLGAVVGSTTAAFGLLIFGC